MRFWINKGILFYISALCGWEAVQVPANNPPTGPALVLFFALLVPAIIGLFSSIVFGRDELSFTLPSLSTLLPASKLEKAAALVQDLKNELALHTEDSPFKVALEQQISESEQALAMLVAESKYSRASGKIKKARKLNRKVLKA